jgi:hypothetical protein
VGGGDYRPHGVVIIPERDDVGLGFKWSVVGNGDNAADSLSRAHDSIAEALGTGL